MSKGVLFDNITICIHVGWKTYTENFMDYAFTAEEKAAVKTTTLTNNDNPEYETAGGAV